jgi:hypothetical protein
MSSSLSSPRVIPSPFQMSLSSESKGELVAPTHRLLLQKRGPVGRRPGKFSRSKKGKSHRSSRGAPVARLPNSRNPLQSFGDMTLRDAADMTASAIKGGLRIATRILNVEEKILDTVVGAFTATQTATIGSLSLIGTGNDYYQRTGLSVGARNVRLAVSAIANATAVTNFLRIVVLQDLENNGSAPTQASVFESTGNDGYLCAYNHINGNRFRVLMDEHVVVISGQQAYFKRFVLPIDTDILYQGTGTTTASGYNGTLFAYFISDAPVNGPLVAFDARLTYVDN